MMNYFRLKLLFGGFLFFCFLYLIPFAANSVELGLVRSKFAVKEKPQDCLLSIPMQNLTIEGEIGRRISNTIHNNIEKLDLDKNFTGHFERKTGPDIVGAFVGMGMLIDASVRFAAYSNEQEIIDLKNNIVDKIINSQLDDGYSGFYKPERRLWNTGGGGDNWDIHEMAFIIDGLVSDFQLFGNERSLNAAIKTADFIIDRWSAMPADYANEVDMHVLDTGIDWAMVKLFKETGEKRFLNFVENQKPLKDWNTPIIIGRRPGVSGHMFAYFAMCMAQIEMFRLTGEDQFLEQTRKAMDFFLQNDGLTITGSAGQREIWTNDQDGANELGETCSTAYQIRVYESLLRLTGDSKYGDLMERTVYNGLFAAQSPDGSQLRYYTPFEGERKYYPHEHMCCPGNYRRIVSELPGMLYYTMPDKGLAINLYSHSSASFNLSDGTKVKLVQKTDYPSSGDVEIRVLMDQQVSFPILLRIPSWAVNAKVMINGHLWTEKPMEGSFLSIKRKWSSNDQIVIEFPMNYRFIKGRKRNAGRVALMRGPVIYGLNLEKNTEATAHGERDFYDLQRILLDPKTIDGPFPDDSVRPNGTATFMKAWRENFSGKADRKHEFNLKLTEFADPGSQYIYFKIPDYSIEVEDELLEKP